MRPCICAALLAVCMLLVTPSGAAEALVVDASGREYRMKSVRLSKGSRLNIECGGARLKAPFKSVKSLKIYPARIKSVNGRLHYEAELRLSGAGGFGGSGDGRCFVPADNGIRGKSAKVSVTVPFSGLDSVYIFGKEDRDAEKAGTAGAAGAAGTAEAAAAAESGQPPAAAPAEDNRASEVTESAGGADAETADE